MLLLILTNPLDITCSSFFNSIAVGVTCTTGTQSWILPIKMSSWMGEGAHEAPFLLQGLLAFYSC